ncbi:hypothetical protein LTR56_007488 [Elasticomyces elasticus]|nr:hypothetical protein LTR56_007488 [Elasticomyces elasticus]KAK3668190.1 hypothetical protein LTR22_000875 [Elasticomyces elasticus]KAK4921364.1 hypothetical protein LTR49_011194 [Elasticomyces elasticus]KAK5769483.1 hypothetical protein LTS12_000410 [Elasticomyces elasticus]
MFTATESEFSTIASKDLEYTQESVKSNASNSNRSSRAPVLTNADRDTLADDQRVLLPTAMISQTTNVYGEKMASPKQHLHAAEAWQLDDHPAHSDPASSPWYPMRLSPPTPTACEKLCSSTRQTFGVYQAKQDLQFDP